MAESTRMYARMSFVAVLVIVGVPLWWKTTEVYRVALPYQRISELEKLPMKISMLLVLAYHNTERGKLIQEELTQMFNQSDVYDLKFDLLPRIPDSLKHGSPSPEVLQGLERGPGSLLLLETPHIEEEVTVTGTRTILMAENTSAVKLSRVLREWLLCEESVRTSVLAMRLGGQARLDSAGRRRMRPTPAIALTLSVAVPSPDLIHVKWDAKTNMEAYLQPFVAALQEIHNFTLKSQWLYFVQLDFHPKEVPDNSEFKRHFILSEDVLPHLITPLEKKLSSHISKEPCLNLVLYVPPCQQAPIYIYTKQAVGVEQSAFLSPRWGGVVIANPPARLCVPPRSTSLPEFRPSAASVMPFFLTQLRQLLGIQNTEPIPGVGLEELRSARPRDWELDALMRIRTIEQVTSAKLTLRSLAQLLGEISNIVINDEVGASIYTAVSSVEATSLHLSAGRSLEALRTSRQAFLAAEAAFTDPSLLALLYFPDDQKYAVYIPLFLPVMIPVLLSIKNIYSWWKSTRQEQDKLKTE